MRKLKAIIAGFGMRGEAYAKYAHICPEELEIVGVADPVKEKREYAAKLYNIDEKMVFSSWEDILNLPKCADFVVLGTQDKDHCEPAIKLIDKGYDLLLEKPMAPTAKESKKIMAAAEKKGVRVVVCHVLRYTDFWVKIKDIIDSGALGKIMSVVHVEGVGDVHFSHSFTRGNWSNSKESAPMILAKSCHDTDLLQWLIGKECKSVQSFGSLTHFTSENMPEGAANRCSDGCKYADSCYYNAVKFYVDNKDNAWRPVVANKPVPTDEEILEALKKGPYGRCVFACNNDVVDHQVVNMEFEDGCTVSFSMNPFNNGGRNIRIYGTRGELFAEQSKNEIEVYSFDTREWEKHSLTEIGEGIEAGHGGGDFGIMRDFVKYLRDGEMGKSISTIRTSYLSHIIAFAAEKSRLTGKVIDIDKFSKRV